MKIKIGDNVRIVRRRKHISFFASAHMGQLAVVTGISLSGMVISLDIDTDDRGVWIDELVLIDNKNNIAYKAKNAPDV